ncbi:DUF302 domain-containing protein [Methylotenera sp. G11]|uniref:DUF302 domain-containing protein n=1 Tax=Methylotenera sp. G11 TaxID=1506585 RepID=UPI000647A88D|nr:DUF302 domain-containing protein [Methylotenera sp. G11]
MAVLVLSVTACAANKPVATAHNELIGKVRPGMPAIDPGTAIYELAVNDGVSYQDVVDSLKSLSEGLNFVNPANFPIGEHMKLRGVDPQGMKEVRSFCNLSMGTEIILDHPEFLVFAPCRIAIYEKPDADHKLKLFIAMDRPTYDLKSIKNPTARAQKSAQELETVLLEIMDRARKGDF